jgi:hypothetical protein
MKTKIMALSALAVIVAAGAMAAEPRGIQTYEFQESFEQYWPCADEMVRVNGIIEVRSHLFETKNGTLHLIDSWFIHHAVTGLSSGREWIGEGVSPFQASLKADQGGVSQWVSRIRYTPVVAGDPKFMYQNEYKVTVNANGELVVERLADPMEDAFRCLSKK